MVFRFLSPAAAVAIIVFCSCTNRNDSGAIRQPIYAAQGIMAGDITQTSVMFRTRLTATPGAVDGDIAGREGAGAFEISTEPDFPHYLRTEWLHAVQDSDFVIRKVMTNLKPDTRYYYRAVYAIDPDSLYYSGISSFRTWPENAAADTVTFVVAGGVGEALFQESRNNGKSNGTPGAMRMPLKKIPALGTIAGIKPDFIVGAYDNGIPDASSGTREDSIRELRRELHVLPLQPQFAEVFSSIPGYWMDASPSSRIFHEQFPVDNPEMRRTEGCRTVRINELLELWFVDDMDILMNGAASSGDDPAEWFKNSLKESGAAFKILITPEMLIGPEDSGNEAAAHAESSPGRAADSFFTWLSENGFRGSDFFIVCCGADRQYHSMNTFGFGEFACGTLVSSASEKESGNKDTRDTTPEAHIRHPYTQTEPSGGFLAVTFKPAGKNGTASLEFGFYDPKGIPLYSTVKEQRQ